MKRSYVFTNPNKQRMVRAIDAVGGLLVHPRQAAKINSQKFKNILVVSLEMLGDNVFATPIPRVLKENFPDCKVFILANSSFTDVFSGNPNVDELISFDTPWFPRKKRRTSIFELRKLAKELRKRNFDLGMDIRGDLRHNLILFLAGIPVRIGYGISGGGFLLTNEVPYPWDRHQVEKGLAVLAPLGIGVDKAKTEIYPSAQLRELIFNEFGLNGSSSVIALHPSASAQAKRWPAERFAKVADFCISELGARVFVTGSDGDRGLVSEMLSVMREKPELFLGRSLSELIAFLSGIDLFIAGDTGPLHLAIAAGTAAIAIYSANYDPAIWGPYGENCTIIRKEVPCRLCYKTICDDHICMEAISVEDVTSTVQAILKDKFSRDTLDKSQESSEPSFPRKTS